MKIAISKNRNHLVFTETAYDADGFGQTKRGVVEINNPLADEDGAEIPAEEREQKANAMLAKAQGFTWKLGDEADSAGFYKVERGSAVKTVASSDLKNVGDQISHS